MSTLAEITPALQTELKHIHSICTQLIEVGGPRLDNFSLITLRDVRSFERACRAFWRSYAAAIVSITNNRMAGIDIEGIFYLRHFQRLFEYRKQGRPYEILHQTLCIRLSCLHSKENRILAAARVHWIENRMKTGKELYPTVGRYTPLNQDKEFLFQHLSPKAKWLVDFTIAPSWESDNLLTHMENIMSLRREWETKFTDLMDFITAEKLSNTPRVEEFTMPYTEEARQSENNTICDICDYTFDIEFDDVKLTEPAVKTKCNHIFGTFCLQNWISSGHSTCPNCRHSLYDVELVLPKAVVGRYTSLKGLFAQVEALDPEIDRYLMGGEKILYDEQFLPLVRNMDRLGVRCHHLIEDMYETIQIAASMQDAVVDDGSN